MITNILIIIIVLHLLAGFGFILFQLSGPPTDSKEQKDFIEDDQDNPIDVEKL